MYPPSTSFPRPADWPAATLPTRPDQADDDIPFHHDQASALPDNFVNFPLNVQPGLPVYWLDGPTPSTARLDPSLQPAVHPNPTIPPYHPNTQYPSASALHQDAYLGFDANANANADLNVTSNESIFRESISNSPAFHVASSISAEPRSPWPYQPSLNEANQSSFSSSEYAGMESSKADVLDQMLSFANDLKVSGRLAETEALKLQILEKDLIIAKLRGKLQESERMRHPPKASLLCSANSLPKPLKPTQASSALQPIPRLNNQRVSKVRAAFTDVKRKETAMTRKIGACFYCRRRKERCTASPLDPYGQCRTCAALNGSMYSVPCIRTRIPQVDIFRTITTEKDTWTLRPEIYLPTELTDVLHTKVKVIEITQDAGDPLTVSVSEFIPIEGDETSYKWEFEGVETELAMPCFAIVNVSETKASLQAYIVKNMTSFVDKFTEDSSSIVWNTFQMAIKRKRESVLLQKLLELWTSSRLIEEPWRICGEETLGVTLEDTVGTPYEGKIPVSPVMDSQLDQIIIQSLLMPLRTQVLRMLDVKMSRAKREDWFETFLAVFVLLNNIELATAHDHEFATFHGHVTPGRGTRFEDYKLVESYFHAAQVIIAHFRDAIGGHLPFQPNWTAKAIPGLSPIDEEEIQYVEMIKLELEHLKSSLFSLRTSHRYESMLYWTHQLFYDTWDSSQVLIRELEDGEDESAFDIGLAARLTASAH